MKNLDLLFDLKIQLAQLIEGNCEQCNDSLVDRCLLIQNLRREIAILEKI